MRLGRTNCVLEHAVGGTTPEPPHPGERANAVLICSHTRQHDVHVHVPVAVRRSELRVLLASVAVDAPHGYAEGEGGWTCDESIPAKRQKHEETVDSYQQHNGVALPTHPHECGVGVEALTCVPHCGLDRSQDALDNVVAVSVLPVGQHNARRPNRTLTHRPRHSRPIHIGAMDLREQAQPVVSAL